MASANITLWYSLGLLAASVIQPPERDLVHRLEDISLILKIDSHCLVTNIY